MVFRKVIIFSCCLYLDAVFVHVDVMLPLSASPRLAEEDEVLKQEHLTHHLLPALEHQELILPQQFALFLQVHLKTIMIKVFIKCEILSVETILSAHTHAHAHTHTHTHSHTYTHTHTHTHTHTRAKTHTCVRTHTHTHAATPAHARTHTRTHTHTHTHTHTEAPTHMSILTTQRLIYTT